MLWCNVRRMATHHLFCLQLFVWDLVRCTVVWSYLVAVKSLAVDMSVNYKANLVFPSPSSLVSSFVVSDGQHIFLFNPSSSKVRPVSILCGQHPPADADLIFSSSLCTCGRPRSAGLYLLPSRPHRALCPRDASCT
jgi:hypothetical protein